MVLMFLAVYMFVDVLLGWLVVVFLFLLSWCVTRQKRGVGWFFRVSALRLGRLCKAAHLHRLPPPELACAEAFSGGNSQPAAEPPLTT